MTAIGSDYFPKTASGRVLSFLLGLFAIAVCAYLAATPVTFFVSQNASERAELAGTKSLQALPAEITALRTEIQILSQKG
jgi:voltage-gated potassium channel